MKKTYTERAREHVAETRNALQYLPHELIGNYFKAA